MSFGQKAFFVCAAALLNSTFAFAANYSCRLNVYGGTNGVDSTSVTYSAPGGVFHTEFEGISLNIYGADDKSLNLRLGPVIPADGDGRSFPYAHARGYDNPSRLSGVLATGTAIAAMVDCQRL